MGCNFISLQILTCTLSPFILRETRKQTKAYFVFQLYFHSFNPIRTGESPPFGFWSISPKSQKIFLETLCLFQNVYRLCFDTKFRKIDLRLLPRQQHFQRDALTKISQKYKSRFFSLQNVIVSNLKLKFGISI